MSKVNIRFIYRNQEEQEVKPVKSLHRGPINLSNLYETYVNPSYHQIEIDQSNNPVNEIKQPETATFRKQIPTTSSIQVVSKPTSPKSPIQKILKEPQNATKQEHFSAQLKTNKPKRIESLKPSIKIQETKEKQLIRKSQNKKNVRISTEEQVPDGQIKSPSYKYIPKPQGQINHCTRKEYVRAQKTQKYLYNGIPQKSEDDFVGCFGCFDTKPKTFQARHNK